MPPAVESFITRNRFVVLFASLLLFLISVPIVQELRQADQSALPNIIEVLAFFVVLASAVVSVTKSPTWKYFLAALGFPAAVLTGLATFLVSDALALARSVFAIAFLGYVMTVLLLYVFTDRRVTQNTLCAALCVYLLMGVAWAVAYSLINILNPSAFAALQSGQQSNVLLRIGQGGGANALYFSLCTLTTLGYGDIVPASPFARTFAVLEALVGQLYLTVLVARLVGLHIADSLGPTRSD